MSVCIYTACYGGYDEPRSQAAQDVDVDWLYFTEPDASRAPDPWRTIETLPREDTPMLAAKWWKLHPPVGYDHAIWVDANMEITSAAFAREAIATLGGPGAYTFGVWRHPRRDCVYDEIAATLGAERQGDKYDDARLTAQGDAYRDEGYPTRNGLYANGTIVWTPEAWPISKTWWDEILRTTHQDQVSLPVVCWRLGVVPAVFPVGQIERRTMTRGAPWLSNRWLRIHPHNTVNV